MNLINYFQFIAIIDANINFPTNYKKFNRFYNDGFFALPEPGYPLLQRVFGKPKRFSSAFQGVNFNVCHFVCLALLVTLGLQLLFPLHLTSDGGGFGDSRHHFLLRVSQDFIKHISEGG